MREILFRGKRIDNGEWVYGAFVPDALEQTHGEMVTWGFIRRYQPNRTVESVEMIEVHRCTIGQYTGLHDKNGKRVFEGDVILWGDNSARARGTAIQVVVEFRSGCFGVNDGERFHEFYHYCADRWDDSEITDDMWGELPIEKYFRACFEVISTIHDKGVSA